MHPTQVPTSCKGYVGVYEKSGLYDIKVRGRDSAGTDRCPRCGWNEKIMNSLKVIMTGMMILQHVSVNVWRNMKVIPWSSVLQFQIHA